MTREIKFRAWNGEKMIYESIQKEYDDYYMLNLQGEFFPHTRTGDTEWSGDRDPENRKHHSLMQYTGLKDKNGREIYEGDVWKYRDGDVVTHAVIKWCNDRGGWDAVRSEDGESMVLHYGFDVLKDGEVIGNIHENPELITN